MAPHDLGHAARKACMICSSSLRLHHHVNTWIRSSEPQRPFLHPRPNAQSAPHHGGRASKRPGSMHQQGDSTNSNGRSAPAASYFQGAVGEPTGGGSGEVRALQTALQAAQQDAAMTRKGSQCGCHLG